MNVADGGFRCVYVKDPNAEFPLVPSKAFPGEKTLSCPDCGSTDITMQGKNLLGAGVNKIFCGTCGFTAIKVEG